MQVMVSVGYFPLSEMRRSQFGLLPPVPVVMERRDLGRDFALVG